MAITDSIIRVSEWLNTEVCPGFKLKKAPDNRAPQDAGYQYELVTPHAFPLFVPTKDKLPPGVHTNIPSVCVQIVDGTDNIPESRRDINVNLGISCWNPGVHSKDIFYPKGTAPDAPEPYASSYDGWMDAWNFVDAIIRKVESSTSIGGMVLAPDVPVKFGPYKEQDSIPDFYPNWFAYVQFTLREEFVRNNPDIEELL